MMHYPRVTIRNSSDLPISDCCVIELDGQQLTSVTAVRVDGAVGELVTVTLSMFANVDIDTPAVVQRVDPEPPKVTEVQRLAPLRPGDTLIYETDERLNACQAEDVEAYLKSRFPDNPVVVVIAGGHLKVSSQLPQWHEITGEVREPTKR